MAQLGVLFRALVTGGVFYVVWTFISGGSFDLATYGKIAAVLWMAANVVFWVVKMYRPDVLNMAKFVEEDL